MNSNNLIIIGSIASLVLLVLYFTQKGQSGGGSVNAVYEVSGITPEVAAINSSERINANNNAKDITLGWLSLFLGKDTNQTQKDITGIQADAAIKTTIDTNASQVKINADNAAASQTIAQANATASERIASINAAGAAQVAKNQQPTKLQSIFGGLGSIVSGVGKFFGL